VPSDGYILTVATNVAVDVLPLARADFIEQYSGDEPVMQQCKLTTGSHRRIFSQKRHCPNSS